ncbi:SusC/RagA family TonB-linked outer membrane protein [Pedobacter jeongneungensis]|uniref:SusC/RagA family TonB-linked outer membrane protein n=1 Tax=Pedobacter jeongneungensis TaxID=947309 RepID=UPI000469D8BC|nr:SusC/RagA family TonB-linked outer membrane protein [Pedobacter jeongneungensis]
MKKLIQSLFILVLFAYSAMAQERTITGTVTSGDDKQAIPGVSVKITGGQGGTVTDANGKFSIKVSSTATTLEFSYIGYARQTKPIGEATINVVLVPDAKALDEVVVTALGQTRKKNTLSYAAQQVKGEELSQTRSANAASALSGKVSGLQIIQGNAIGGSTNVVIRGSKSLTGNNQALFVVDGVPVDNSNNNSKDQKTGRGGYDYGNAAADINPDDIESVNVLKGAAASALYGSRGANGVIMITTKSRKSNGMGITINSGVTIGHIDRSTFPKYQKEYGAGYSDGYDSGDGFYLIDVLGNGIKEKVAPTGEDASYGAKFDSNLLVYQWDAFDPSSPTYHQKTPWVAAKNDPSTFYETSISNSNSIMLDGASDKGTFKLGYSRNDERGTLPNSKVLKNIINFGGTYKITERLTASALANFSKVDGLGRYGSGYSGLNVNQNFRQWYQTNVDIQEQKEAYFRNERNISWNWGYPSDQKALVARFTDNYYWTRYKNYQNDTRSRIFGNASLNYKVTDYLNILGRVSLDSYNEFQEERIASGSKEPGMYSRTDRTFHETNFDLIANFDRNLNEDFNLKALAGVNIRQSLLNDTYSTTNGGLIVPGLYSVANSVGTIAAPVENYEPKEVDGVFGGATLSYKEFLTLEGTFRRDKSSTLPVGNNAYNYYSIAGSWLFSKHLEKELSWLSSGKIRINYATVGNDAPWGSTRNVYLPQSPFGSTTLFASPITVNNAELKPEQTESSEVGLEMAFLQNRIGFDASYYLAKSKNQIFAVATSAAVGFTNKFVNSGVIRNNGIELSLYGSPVKTKEFSWNINVNWTKNNSKVLELYNGSTNLQLASFNAGISINATLGQPYGTIQGKDFVYDASGQKVIGPKGYYLVTNTTTNVIGNVNPKWIGGIQNTFKYKNVSLGFLVDFRHGGNVWSLDQFYATYSGVLPNTIGLNDLGNPMRDPITNDSKSGGVILEGVTEDGKPNTKRVMIDANSPAPPPSAFSYDASYIKLREATLTYSLPKNIVSKLGPLKAVDLSVFGRNLWIIHKNLPYSDPEENLSSGNIQGVQSGAYPTTRTIGFNAKISF